MTILRQIPELDVSAFDSEEEAFFQRARDIGMDDRDSDDRADRIFDLSQVYFHTA